MECFKTTKLLLSQLPYEINMAETTLEVTRSFDVAFGKGYELDKKKLDEMNKKLFGEQESLTTNHQKFCDMIQHHHKLCLCLVCKWWIISNAKLNKNEL